tara:strand:- start:2663 stop:3262 length:600 start_codon:yes stop_codon:yes gene_type:complete
MEDVVPQNAKQPMNVLQASFALKDSVRLHVVKRTTIAKVVRNVQMANAADAKVKRIASTQNAVRMGFVSQTNAQRTNPVRQANAVSTLGVSLAANQTQIAKAKISVTMVAVIPPALSIRTVELTSVARRVCANQKPRQQAAHRTKTAKEQSTVTPTAKRVLSASNKQTAQNKKLAKQGLARYARKRLIVPQASVNPENA